MYVSPLRKPILPSTFPSTFPSTILFTLVVCLFLNIPFGTLYYRLLSNRPSAARPREKKMRYIADLERAVRMLQTEAASLSLQLTTLQVKFHLILVCS